MEVLLWGKGGGGPGRDPPPREASTFDDVLHVLPDVLHLLPDVHGPRHPVLDGGRLNGHDGRDGRLAPIPVMSWRQPTREPVESLLGPRTMDPRLGYPGKHETRI